MRFVTFLAVLILAACADAPMVQISPASYMNYRS